MFSTFSNYPSTTRFGFLMRRHASYLNAVETASAATADYATEVAQNEATVDLTDTTPVTGENPE